MTIKMTTTSQFILFFGLVFTFGHLSHVQAQEEDKKVVHGALGHQKTLKLKSLKEYFADVNELNLQLSLPNSLVSDSLPPYFHTRGTLSIGQVNYIGDAVLDEKGIYFNFDVGPTLFLKLPYNLGVEVGPFVSVDCAQGGDHASSESIEESDCHLGVGGQINLHLWLIDIGFKMKKGTGTYGDSGSLFIGLGINHPLTLEVDRFEVVPATKKGDFGPVKLDSKKDQRSKEKIRNKEV